MNYEKVKIKPTKNGFKASVEIPKKILDLELNEYINKIDEINRLIINDENELYIRELLNRINKAVEKLKLCNSQCAKETIEILKGDNKEN